MIHSAGSITVEFGDSQHTYTVTNIESAQDRLLLEKYRREEVSFTCSFTLEDNEEIFALMAEYERRFWMQPEDGTTIYSDEGRHDY